MTGADHWVAAPVGFVQAEENNVLAVENSVGFQVCDPELLGIIEDAASFDSNRAGSPADWLGRPVSCVLALDFSIAVKNVVINAAIFNLLPIAVHSHHSKGDEAVGDPCWDGAAHLQAHGGLSCSPISPAGASLMTRSLWRGAFICPAVSVFDCASGDGFIVDYFSTRGWFGQRAVHSFAERWGIAPGSIMQTSALVGPLHDVPVITGEIEHTLIWGFCPPHRQRLQRSGDWTHLR